MSGFKPNDNAKNIKGSLLRLAPLLLMVFARAGDGFGVGQGVSGRGGGFWGLRSGLMPGC